MNSSWLVKLDKQSPPAFRLFCFPFAGGGTIAFRRWRNDLASCIELDLLNYPGREARLKEPFVDDFTDLINKLYSTIEANSEIPFAFYGHSYGTLVAYVLACRLLDASATLPVHIFLSAARPPHLPPKRYLADLPEEEFIQQLTDLYQGIPEAILQDASLLKLFIPIVRQDFKVYKSYYENIDQFPARRLPCPTTVIGYKQDHIIQQDLVEWQQYSNRMIDLLMLEGNHFELLKNWKPVTDIINDKLQAMVKC